MITFSYGQGHFIQDDKQFEGEIILTEHKLYLRDEGHQEIAMTFVPLEKIDWVQLIGNQMTVHVKPNLYFQYVAIFQGQKKKMKELAVDLAKVRGFKKKLFQSYWYEGDV